MVIDLVTSEISSYISDIIVVAGLFLLAFVSMRSLKLMQAGAEFDRQYKNELASNPSRFKNVTAEFHDKWRNEYIQARSNPQRYSAKKKTQQVFNKTSSVAFKSNQLSKAAVSTKKQSELKPQNSVVSIRQTKQKYGINKRHSYFNRTGKFMRPATPRENAALNAGKNPESYKEFKAKMPKTLARSGGALRNA